MAWLQFYLLYFIQPFIPTCRVVFDYIVMGNCKFVTSNINELQAIETAGLKKVKTISSDAWSLVTLG